MNFVAPALTPATPEIVLLALACVVLIVDVMQKTGSRMLTYTLTQITLLLTLVSVIMTRADKTILTFSDTYIQDQMGFYLKVFILIITMIAMVYSRDYLRQRKMERGEYYLLSLFATLGMLIMVSAYSLLNIYLGLELLSLSLYAMVAFDRNSSRSSEAAMKYFVLGAIASGMLLYGMSILYGVTGTLNINEINALLQQGGDISKAQVFALVFIVVALAFKLGAVPFHMWVPDVYDGAPTSVTLFIGAAPKLAAFAMVMRLLVSGMGVLHEHWQGMLIILAVLSIGIGNIVAIAQTSIKRMLAYSTISHVGFIILGVLAGTRDGFAASMFYTIIYAFMSLGAFGVILLLSREGFEADEISDFAGLGRTHPWIAVILMILLLSMAGVPPTAGFYAKLVVLKAVIGVELTWLAIYAVILSVIGAYYYLRVMRVMFFDAADENADHSLATSTDAKVILSVNGLLMLVAGILPGPLLAWCISSM